MNRKRFFLLLGAVGAMLVAHDAQGGLIVYDGSSTDNRTDDAFIIGNKILVGSVAQTINRLGVQDTSGSGAGSDGFLGGGVEVGLWETDGTLLASTTVLSTDPLNADTYRYRAVAPVTLQPNTEYLIGALVGLGLEGFLDGEYSAPNTAPFSANTGFTLVDAMFTGFPGTPFLVHPQAGGFAADPGRWAPANATFIPEPSSVLLLSLAGLISVAATRRRK